MSFWIYMIVLIGYAVRCSRRRQETDGFLSLKQNLPIRGILAILVVYSHTIPQAYLFGRTAVALFFCFSGYGITYKYRNGKMSPGGLLRSIGKVFISVVFYNLLWCLYLYLIGAPGYSLLQYLVSFFTASIYSVLWYCIALMLLYVLHYAVYSSRLASDKKWVALSLGVCVLMVTLRLLECGVWWYCSLPAFALGAAFCEKPMPAFLRKPAALPVQVLAFVALYAAAFGFGINDSGLFVWMSILLSLSICTLYYTFSSRFTIVSRPLSFIGDHSLSLYLIHPMLMKPLDGLLIKVLRRLGMMQAHNIYTLAPKAYDVYTFVLLAVSLALAVVFDRWIGRVRRALGCM